jgi:hypothetical protein
MERLGFSLVKSIGNGTFLMRNTEGSTTVPLTRASG